MQLLSVSRALLFTGDQVLEELYSKANDHDLDTRHTTLTYESDGPYVNVTIKARALTDDFQPGRYSEQTQVRYRRENLRVLFNGQPIFLFAHEWPVTFSQVKEHLKGTYGVVLENQDILLPGDQTTTIVDEFVFRETDSVNNGGIISLHIAPKSPRFLPFDQGGDSVLVKVIDPNGADLELLGPTKLLPPITSLDA